MKVATIVFTYNRGTHTDKVLTALRENEILPDKLFLFQDGLKTEQHLDEWNKVNRLIAEVNWCDCEVIVSERNKGLAASIVDGINYVLGQYDAVIVLEDDCVPHPGFMSFMYQALEKYHNHKEVYSVSGYGFPFEIRDNGTDAYFSRRISSWGWGTWRDRWDNYEQDYRILGRIKKNTDSERELHIWGEDLESYLLGNIYGNCDSWATFWALNVIERKGYCLSPYKSLIHNIGFDGSGVHCGVGENTEILYDKSKCDFRLPDKIEIIDECEKAFSEYYSWTSPQKRLASYNELLIKWIEYLHCNKASLLSKLQERGIKRCSIWGKGKICDLLLKEFEGKVEVPAIIESHPRMESYRGIPIVGMDEIPEETQAIIVIPVYDFPKIERTAKSIIKCQLLPLDSFFDA